MSRSDLQLFLIKKPLVLKEEGGNRCVYIAKVKGSQKSEVRSQRKGVEKISQDFVVTGIVFKGEKQVSFLLKGVS